MARVVVIGAGVTGVTSAYALLRRGHEVTVVDRHRYPAMETSFANGGQLSASNAEVWNSWGTILKGMKWLFRKDAPLLLNPSINWHKYSWLSEFSAQILHYRRNTIETTRLAISARRYLFEIAEQEGINFDLERRGILHIYHDEKSLKRAAVANGLLNEGGLERYAVSPQEIASIEPTLHGRFAGGFYTPSDSTGDIRKFTQGLAACCQRRGAALVLGGEVEAINVKPDSVSVWVRTEGDGRHALRADAVLVCAGVYSRRFAAMLGDRINIYPVKGYSITVGLPEASDQRAAPQVSLLDEDAKIVTSRLGPDRFRVAGTAEFNGYNRDIRADRIRPLVDWCERLFPAMSTAAIVPWAGLRPMTPSMLPRVGRGRRRRVFYNTGHGHLGWTLSAATAEIAAEHIETSAGFAQ